MNYLRLCLFFTLVMAVHGAGPLDYAPRPNDKYWLEEWHLENINETNGIRRGIDINAREAWAYSRGAGVTIAIVDNGVDSSHVDLAGKGASGVHFNFSTGQPDGEPSLDHWGHGTAVAGIASAAGYNGRGVIGVAPETKYASWVMYSTNTGTFVDRAAFAQMFQTHIDQVQVQNHSFVFPGEQFTFMTQAESNSIQKAVTEGRAGKGVVIVRATGNERVNGRNVNDDAFTADPRAITVAAVRSNGRAASYSNPGASILVSGPSGDTSQGYPNIFTTDRPGMKGLNQFGFIDDPELSDYVFAGLGFGGTSAATPMISGITALVLSADPQLTYRDVQQIMILAAAQTDPDDPDLIQNGAGFSVSHNTGFGLVNAGIAVDLARHWTPRPTATKTSGTVEDNLEIPDTGIRLLVTSGIPLPPGYESIPTLPSLGMHIEEPTTVVPLVYVGQAVTPLTTNLAGKAALIQRGGGDFSLKIENAARAGAVFAVVYNNSGTDSLQVMGGTDFVTIPAVFISQMHGEALANVATNNPTQTQLHIQKVKYDLDIAESLSCEHVVVHLNFSHEFRGDLRATLVSPSGTRSVLHRLGPDTNSFNGTWSYMSTHHFYEPSKGKWQLDFSDEFSDNTGTVHSAILEIRGVPIIDVDNDGLPDDWELTELLSLNTGPKDDPDTDGYSNIREWIMGTDPAVNETHFGLGINRWNKDIVRLNFPSKAGVEYEVLGNNNVEDPFNVLTTLVGQFPRTSFLSIGTNAHRFYLLSEK